MELIQNLILVETEKNTQRYMSSVIEAINASYNDWKAKKRRKNATNLVSSTVNRISKITPSVLVKLPDAIIMKLSWLLMRCMDCPSWEDVNVRASTYKKLYPLIDKLQHISLQTGTNGTLREVIMTRLSATISYKDANGENPEIFVSYEPLIPGEYLKYLFLDKKPLKTVKMIALPLPASFESLIKILEINHDKAKKQANKNNKP